MTARIASRSSLAILLTGLLAGLLPASQTLATDVPIFRD